MNSNVKNAILVAVLVLVALVILLLEDKRPQGADNATIRTVHQEEKARTLAPAKEITSPDGFINTDLITIGQFVGKSVVLLDFWTYSCINCQRTIPYLNSWWGKYKDKGLVIIGVHTPEFKFEQEYENVQRAVKQHGILYPVVLDNDYSTWYSYKNRYWPRKYLIDIDGYIVYDHIGEGGYEETERKIQELLAERAERLNLEDTSSITLTKEDPNLVSEAQSPEIYFGAFRNLYLGNGASNTEGEQTLALPENFKTNILYLSGTWRFENEYAENKISGARVVFRYHARDVYMVARAASPVRARVLVDDKPISKEYAGADVSEDGFVTIEEERLYKLIRGPVPGEHTLRLEVSEPGLHVFTFTFG